MSKCSLEIKQMINSIHITNYARISDCRSFCLHNIYSKILKKNRQPFRVHSIAKKHHCNNTLNNLELYTVFGCPKYSLFGQEFAAIIGSYFQLYKLLETLAWLSNLYVLPLVLRD